MILIWILFIIASTTSLSQRVEDYRYWDSLTYKLYLDSDWKNLSQKATESINRGYDYYYMRMRLGISLYERKNYLSALKHFRKALESNEGDPIALEYIYYSYLLSGRDLNSRAVRADFGSILRENTAATAGSTRISADYMCTNSQSDDLITAKETVYGWGLPGNLVIPMYFTNLSLSASFPLSDFTTLFQSVTGMERTNYFYYNDGINSSELPEQKVRQYQYYLSLIFGNRKGLVVSPAFHYINVRYPLIYFSGSGIPPAAYTYINTDHNIVTGISINQLAGLFEFQISAHYMYLNYANHLQGSAGIYLYPTGNNHLYLGISYFPRYSETGSGWDFNSSSRGLLGIGISGRIWLEFSGMIGDMTNFVYKNGYIVYNGVEAADRMANIDIGIPLGGSGLVFYGGAGFVRQYCSYVPEPGIIVPNYTQKINSIKILGGLSWKF